MKTREAMQDQWKPWANDYANRKDLNPWMVKEAACQELAWYSRNRILLEQDLHLRVVKYALFLDNPQLKSDERQSITVRKDFLLYVLA